MNSKKLIRAISIISIFPLAALAFVCGCHKEEVKPTPALPPKIGIVSAEKTSFDEVTSKLDKGGNLYLYLSTEQALKGLSEKLAGVSNFLGNIPGVAGDTGETVGKVFDFADAWIKDSGVEQISGVGMSSIAREPGFYYSKLIIHHYPGQNAGVIWSVFGKSPRPLQELDMLPDTTAMAVFSDLDLPLVWNDLQKRIRQLNIPAASDALKAWPDQYKKMTGLDFDQTMASLGGNYGLIFTVDPQKKITLPLPSGAMEIPSPAIAIMVKVNSDLIFNRVDELAKGNPLIIRVDTPELKMRTMTIPIPLPLEVRPSIARSGDYLFLASSDSLIQEILAVKAGKQKGFKSTPEYVRLSQGIPTEGNNFSLVSAQFMKSMTEIQSQALSNQANLNASQVAAFQDALHKGTNGGSFSVGVNGEDGWESVANGSQSIQSLIVPAVVGAGVAAAIAIPNFMKAHSVSHNNACINNLRLIDAAKQQWALEKNRPTTDVPTKDDLLAYLGGKFPTCPDGGVYTIGAVGEKPACSISGHVLP